MAMAPPNDSEPCTQRLPANDELPQQPPPAASDDDRAPAAGTSSSSEHGDHQAAPAVLPAEAEAEAEKKSSAAGSGGELVARRPASAAAAEESARERLKRHRTEMAGRVRIPDMWGQERLLKDWVDCAVFDRPLAATTGLLNARDALVAECATATARRPGPAVSHGSTGRPLRVHNGCS